MYKVKFTKHDQEYNANQYVISVNILNNLLCSCCQSLYLYYTTQNLTTTQIIYLIIYMDVKSVERACMTTAGSTRLFRRSHTGFCLFEIWMKSSGILVKESSPDYYLLRRELI